MSKPRGRAATPLTLEQCIAINLMHRRGVKASVLAKAFGVSKNTIYYRALTGDADSYPNASFNEARAINEQIDRMGVETAWRQYVTRQQIRDVNRVLDQLAGKLSEHA